MSTSESPRFVITLTLLIGCAILGAGGWKLSRSVADLVSYGRGTSDRVIRLHDVEIEPRSVREVSVDVPRRGPSRYFLMPVRQEGREIYLASRESIIGGDLVASREKADALGLSRPEVGNGLDVFYVVSPTPYFAGRFLLSAFLLLVGGGGIALGCWRIHVEMKVRRALRRHGLLEGFPRLREKR